MDLIYTDANKVDVGILQDFELDLAFGEEENDFELVMPLKAHCLDRNYFIYIEGTEYGGIIDGFEVDTENKQISYYGRTWHGIFDSKVIVPASGEDYYVISGDANAILNQLITEFGISGLFEASSEASEVILPSTKVGRYKNAYVELLKIFRNNGGKMQFNYNNNKCHIEVVPLVDYSQDEEFDSDQLTFVIEKKLNTVNHLICLGQGELSNRQRVDLFADIDGNISNTQSLFGIEEYVDVYDYPSVESLEELEKEGKNHFTELRQDGKIDVTLSQTQNFDISDIIGATEHVTGISVTKHISKKIVTIEKNRLKVDYNING